MQHSKSTRCDCAHHTRIDANDWIDFLRQVNGPDELLYMIIDCAHDPRIYPALLKTLNTKCCLFSEEKISESIKAVAPFLVKIKQIDEFISWCIRVGADRNWMIFFTSSINHVSDLRLHFKRFSIAQGPDGKPYFFRFYDPRVLPEFLLSSERERAELFRHCKKILIPRIAPDGAFQRLEFSATGAIETWTCPV